LAGVIAWLTSFADIGPDAVDRARRRDTNVSYEGRAAIAVAPHSSLRVIDQFARDPIKRRIIFQ
jgi:hypothetical protein